MNVRETWLCTSCLLLLNPKAQLWNDKIKTVASNKAGKILDAWTWFIAPTIALHQRHFQSCRRKTLPQVLSQTAHLALTGRLPSNHWWGIAICEEVVMKVKYSEIETGGFCLSNTVRFKVFSIALPFHQGSRYGWPR